MTYFCILSTLKMDENCKLKSLILRSNKRLLNKDKAVLGRLLIRNCKNNNRLYSIKETSITSKDTKMNGMFSQTLHKETQSD